MTRREAIAAAPFSPRAYWLTILFAVLAAIFFGWAFQHTSGLPHLTAAFGVAVIGIYGLQAAERLAFPAQAARRSLRITPHRDSLLTFVWWVRVVSFAGSVALMLVAFPHPHSQYQPAAMMLLTTGHGAFSFVVDLVGQKPVLEPDFEHSPPIITTEIRPLQSAEWGERASSRTLL